MNIDHQSSRKDLNNKMQESPNAAPTERWLPVVGQEGKYEVSDRGNVRSLNRIIVNRNGIPRSRKGCVLKPFLTTAKRRKRYRQVSIDSWPWGVARLMLEAFVGPRPFPGAVARHLNDQERDDRLDNLAWGTPKQNSEDLDRNGHRNPVRGERSGAARVTEAHVLAIRSESARGRTIQSLSQEFGISKTAIGSIVTGRTWTHVGGEIRGPLARTDYQPRGEASVKAKLTEVDVIEIRGSYAAGEITQQQLASKYGVALMTINFIVNRKNWKHVP